MKDQINAAKSGRPAHTTWFLPREHGATAMLLLPMFCSAILARQWRWSELAALIAALAALSAKDPLVVLARQRYVWKQRHPETATAARWFAGWALVLFLCGCVIAAAWPLAAVLGLGLGVALFSLLAVAVNVRNRQRSTLFQIVSAAALTSGALATSLSATGAVALWGWVLWLLMALQAAAGILVVHARLDARIAARGTVPVHGTSRRAAWIAVGALAFTSVGAAALQRGWIAVALLLAASAYGYDLKRQREVSSLQLPLKTTGQQALALSSLFALLLIAGLW